MKYSEQEKETARERLSFLKPGDTVYTEILSVSRSGMTRHIKPFVIRDGEPFWIGQPMAVLLNERVDDNGGLIVSGCGMDMGFELVYNLGRVLFPQGFGEVCREKGCTFRPKTKDEASMVRGTALHYFWGRNGDQSGWDNDGGYAFKQRWL